MPTPYARCVVLALAWLALSGSSCQQGTVRVETLQADRLIYVPVPNQLTQPHAIATGPLSQCPVVAAQRRAELERCNVDKAQIQAIQGTKVEPVDLTQHD